MGKLKVIKVGMMATVQDMGRYGNRKYGIPQSGAMDMQSLKLANYLVGNPLNYPAVETVMQGIQLEALENTPL